MSANLEFVLSDLELLKRQNAQLMRALIRVKQERDDLLKQIAALQAKQVEEPSDSERN
jgi:hypothetical protein